MAPRLRNVLEIDRQRMTPGLAWTLAFAHVLPLHLAFSVTGWRAAVTATTFAGLGGLDLLLVERRDVPRWPRALGLVRAAWAVVCAWGGVVMMAERLGRRWDEVTETWHASDFHAMSSTTVLVASYVSLVFFIPVLIDARGRRARGLLLSLAILGAVLVHLFLAGSIHRAADT